MTSADLYQDFGALYAAAFDWDMADQVGPICAHSGIDSGRILEPMCGNARLLAEFARAGFDTVGIDQSQTMLALAQASYDGLGLQGQWLHTDATNFDLDEACHLAICPSNSLAHLADTASVTAHLNSMSRNLVSGASYWIQLDLKQPSETGQIEDWEFEYLGETLTCEWASTGAHNGFETHMTRFIFPDGRLIESSYEMKLWNFERWQQLLSQTPFNLSGVYRTRDFSPVAITPDLDQTPGVWQQLIKLH